MSNKIHKNISVNITEKEIVSIAQSNFENPKNYISIINWQINQLHNSDFISTNEVDIINDIISNAFKKIKKLKVN